MIALDVMGGDYAPHAVLQGALKIAAQAGIPIKLFGPESVIQSLLTSYDQHWQRYPLVICDAPEFIEMDEEPVNAVRTKRKSSLVQAVQSVKSGECKAVISAGNSGALMVAATFILGRVPGIERSAIAGFMPTWSSRALVLDLGANTECRPHHLFQFAQLGVSYIQQVNGLANPRVGLLANGQEERKGSALTKEAFGLLKQEKSLNFIGNVEPYDLLRDKADVVVTDGFAGNILLKTIEATYELYADFLEKEGESKEYQGLGRLMGDKLAKKMAIKADGGALLLGVQGRVIVCHGNSDAETIERALAFAFSPWREKAKEKINDFQFFHKNLAKDDKFII